MILDEEAQAIRDEAREQTIRDIRRTAERAGNAITALSARAAELEDQLAEVRGQLAELVPVEDYGCLTRHQARIVGALVSANGRILSRRGMLVAACHDMPEADWADEKTIDAHVCYIRRRLREARVPLEIQTVHGFGYRIRKEA